MTHLKKYFTCLFILITGEPTMNAAATIKSETPHWDAELYKKNAIRLQQSSACALLDNIALGSQSRVLDLGCGDGKITIKIAEKVPEGFVEAIDLSQDMLNLAQAEFGYVKNITFTQMDAEDFQFNQPFDSVFSFFCLQWVRNKQQAFQQLANHVKPGGHVDLIMTNRNPYLLNVRNQMLQSEKWRHYFEDYEDPTNVIDDDDYPSYAQNAGLEVTHYIQEDRTIDFDSYDELRAFIKMVSPAIKRLPAEQHDSFIDELTAGYINEIPAIDGKKLYITYTLKTLKATK